MTSFKLNTCTDPIHSPPPSLPPSLARTTLNHAAWMTCRGGPHTSFATGTSHARFEREFQRSFARNGKHMSLVMVVLRTAGCKVIALTAFLTLLLAFLQLLKPAIFSELVTSLRFVMCIHAHTTCLQSQGSPQR